MTAFSTSTGLAKYLRMIGTVAGVTAGSLLILAGAASSQTVTPQSVDPMQHFIDCAGVLISAPDVHAANCLPSNIGPETNSLASTPGGGDDHHCFEDDVIPDGVQVLADSDCEPRDDTSDNTET